MTVRVDRPLEVEAVTAFDSCVGDFRAQYICSRQCNAGRGLCAVCPKTVGDQRKQTTYLFVLIAMFSSVLRGALSALLLWGCSLGYAWVDSPAKAWLHHPLSSVVAWLKGVSPHKAAVALAWSVGAFGAQLAHAEVLIEVDVPSVEVQKQSVQVCVDIQSLDGKTQLDEGPALDCEVSAQSSLSVGADSERRFNETLLPNKANFGECSSRGPPVSLTGIVVNESQRLRGDIWATSVLQGAGSINRAGAESVKNTNIFQSHESLAAALQAWSLGFVVANSFIAKEQQA